MKVDVVLKPPLHWIDNHKRDKERRVAKKKTIQKILEKPLMSVVGKVKRGLMDQERMKRLAKIN
jgi:hypothetical protein